MQFINCLLPMKLLLFSSFWRSIKRHLCSYSSSFRIYARENGQGLFFDPEEYANVTPVENTVESEVQEATETTSTKKTIVKNFRLNLEEESMAFDLVQYFAEQIKIQKPQLLNQYPVNEKIN